jgi:hypothetical protein
MDESQDWVEFEYLSGQIGQLHSRCEAARAMKHSEVVKEIRRELADTAARRQQLLDRLSNLLADKVSVPSATPAAAHF